MPLRDRLGWLGGCCKCCSPYTHFYTLVSLNRGSGALIFYGKDGWYGGLSAFSARFAFTYYRAITRGVTKKKRIVAFVVTPYTCSGCAREYEGVSTANREGGGLWKIIPFPYKGGRTYVCTRANNKILYVRVVVVGGGGGDTGYTGAGRPNGTRALPAVLFAPSVGTHRVSSASLRSRQRVPSAAVVPCTMWSRKAWTVVLGLVIAVTGKNPITLRAGLLAFVFFSPRF